MGIKITFSIENKPLGTGGAIKQAGKKIIEDSFLVINGDIITNKLAIEPGASFTGSCSMGAVIKDIKNVGLSEKQEKSA